MIHVGIDLHRDTCMLQALNDETSELLVDEPLPAEKEALLDCLTPLREQGSMRLVMEACGFAGYWADVLDPLGEVAVLHPKHVAPTGTASASTTGTNTDATRAVTRLATNERFPPRTAYSGGGGNR